MKVLLLILIHTSGGSWGAPTDRIERIPFASLAECDAAKNELRAQWGKDRYEHDNVMFACVQGAA